MTTRTITSERIRPGMYRVTCAGDTTTYYVENDAEEFPGQGAWVLSADDGTWIETVERFDRKRDALDHLRAWGF